MSSRVSPDTLLLGGVLLLTLGIAIYAVSSGRGQQHDDFVRRTTYSPAPGGYQALYEALRELGYPVRRWRAPLDSLQRPGTLVVAAPETPITAAEWRNLAAWVRQGNLLIYLVDAVRPDDLTARLADRLETPRLTSRPVQPTSVAAAAPTLLTRAAFHWDQAEGFFPGTRDEGRGMRDEGNDPASSLIPHPSSLVPLYRDRLGTTVAFTRWGRGTVILSSSSWSLCTAGVGQADNFVWLLATIAAYGPDSGVQAFRRSGVRLDDRGPSQTPASQRPNAPTPQRPNASTPQGLTPVLFDEYHHGYGVQRGILSLLAPIARLGLAQLLVAWLLLLYAVSRRFGGRIPDEGRVRRSRSEYLGSMASLLRRADAVDLAVAQVRRQFLTDARRALGLPQDAPVEALLVVATTRGVDPEPLRALLERAERLTSTRDRRQQGEAVAVARELVRLRRQLSGGWELGVGSWGGAVNGGNDPEFPVPNSQLPTPNSQLPTPND